MRLSSLIIFISLISVSCIESYVPETTSYADILFIEARITNDDNLPPAVLISRATPLDNDRAATDRRPVSSADVYILCDDGSEYPFYEFVSGEYIPVDTDFTGETGKSYKLILYHGGNTYESNFEQLLYSPPIDSINAIPAKEKKTETGEAMDGLKFFISTHDDDPAPSYYRWILDATYIYNVPYSSTHIYNGYSAVRHENRDIIFCWKSYDINDIFISTTEGLSENAVVNAPLNFVGQYGEALSLKYSLHARQLAISKQAYQFWRDMDKLINKTGGLFESQPFRLEGNIRCTTDPSVNVTGIFEVAGVSEGREFFLRPSEFNIIRFACDLEPVGTETLPWSALPEGTYLIEDQPGGYLTANIKCFDCRTRGGTTDRPDFWE